MKHTEKIAPIAAALSALPRSRAACRSRSRRAPPRLLLRWLPAPIAGRLSGLRGAARGWRHAARSSAPCVPDARIRLARNLRCVRHHRAGRGALPAGDRRAARRLDAMNRRKLLLLVLPLALLGAVAYVGFGTHDAPAGQPPLAYLDLSSLAASRLISTVRPTRRDSSCCSRRPERSVCGGHPQSNRS